MRISVGEGRWSVELEDGGRFRVLRLPDGSLPEAAVGYRVMNGRATACTLRHAEYALTDVQDVNAGELADQGREAVQRIADGRAG